MDKKILNKKYTLSQMYLFLSITINVLFAIAIAFLSYSNMNFARNQKIVMQPPFPIEKMTVVWEDGMISADVLRKMGELISFWIMNVTPANAQKSIYKILNYVPAKLYKKTKEQLDKQIFNIVDNNIVQSFYIATINTDHKNIIEVSGSITQTIEDTKIAHKTKWIYIHYKITSTNGFQILSISAKDKQDEKFKK